MLDLLREGLSDQEIADRLEMTLSGAKHHVSDILSRLGVVSRGEAATWEPTVQRSSWWQRAVLLGLAWKATAIVVVLGASVGIGVLAWGVSRTGSESVSAPVFQDLHLPPPVNEPKLSRAQIEAVAATWPGVRAIDIQVSTRKAIAEAIDMPDVLRDQSTAWLLRARLVGSDQQCYAEFCSGGLYMDPRPTPVIACRTVTRIFQEDNPTNTVLTVSDPLPDLECNIP